MTKYKFYAISAMIGVSAILSGCFSTSGMYSKSIQSYDVNKDSGGIVYHLPSTVVQIAVTYTLKCSLNGDASLTVQSATVSTYSIADNDESATYFISQDQLSDWTKKVANADIELNPNGTLKSINYVATDKTSEITTSAVKTLLKLTTGMPTPSPEFTIQEMGVPLRPTIQCNSTQQNRFNNFFNKTNEYKTVKNTYIKALNTAAVTPSKENVARVTHAKTLYTLVPKPTMPQPTMDVKYSCALSSKRAIVQCTIKGSLVNPANAWLNSTTLQTLSVKLKHQHALSSPPKSTPPDKQNGIYYRIPTSTKITIRIDEVIKGEFRHVKSNAVSIDVLQFGRQASLNVENKIFQKNTTKITFDGNGKLTKFEYVDAQARGQVLVDTVNTLRQSKAQAQIDQLGEQEKFLKAHKTLIDTKIDLLKSQKALKDAQDAATTTP